MKDINMKAGWSVKSCPLKGNFTAVHNYPTINEIYHFSVNDIKDSVFLTKQSNCIGRWQPKGTKKKTT